MFRVVVAGTKFLNSTRHPCLDRLYYCGYTDPSVVDIQILGVKNIKEKGLTLSHSDKKDIYILTTKKPFSCTFGMIQGISYKLME